MAVKGQSVEVHLAAAVAAAATAAVSSVPKKESHVEISVPCGRLIFLQEPASPKGKLQHSTLSLT